MNIAEKLRNLPKGNVLYSPAFGEVIFKEIVRNNIVVEDACKIERTFLYDGRFYADGECMLFPSKENKDWNTFNNCPFKAGDFIVREYYMFNKVYKYIAIFSHTGTPFPTTVNYYCIHCVGDSKFGAIKNYDIGSYNECRLATEEEKEKLLKVIKEHGYKWNAETLTLEKEIQKFSVRMLKPFDKVLVRDINGEDWTCDIFSHIVKDYDNQNIFKCVGANWKQCVIYNDVTKYLVGTDKDCPEYFKTW